MSKYLAHFSLEKPLTHCILNRLSHTIILEESNFNFRYVWIWDLHIPREKWLNYSGVILRGNLGEKISLAGWPPYLEVREKWKCIECIGKSKIGPKLLPEILKLSQNFSLSESFRLTPAICKQWRPWTDATFCGVWSRSALFANYPFTGLPTTMG